MVADEIIRRLKSESYGDNIFVPTEVTNGIANHKKAASSAEELNKLTQKRRNMISLLAQWDKETKNLNDDYMNGKAVPHPPTIDGKAHNMEPIKPHVKNVLTSGGTKNIALLEKRLREANHGDPLLIRSILNGFPMVGEAERSHTWPTETREARLQQKDDSIFLSGCNNITLRTKPPQFNSDFELHEIWKKAMKQYKMGVVTKVKESDINFPPACTFGVSQPNKVRLVVNAKANNEATWTPERMKLLGTRYLLRPLHIYSAFLGGENKANNNQRWQSKKGAFAQTQHELLRRRGKLSTISQTELDQMSNGDTKETNPRGSDPAIATRDFEAAYYQCASELPQRNVVAIWQRATWLREWLDNNNIDGESKKKKLKTELDFADKYVVFLGHVLNMGNAHSVCAFCRVSEGLSSIMTRLLQICGLIYVDDSILCECRSTLASAEASWNAFLALIGMHVSLEKSNSTLIRAIKVLGMEYAYIPESRIFAVTIDKLKIEKCKSSVTDLVDSLSCGKTKFDDILSTNGILCHCAYARDFRAGTEIFRFIYQWCEEDNFKSLIRRPAARSKLAKHLAIAMALVEMQKPIHFRRAPAREIVHIFSDARGWAQDKNLPPRLGGVMFASSQKPRAWWWQLTKKQVDRCKGAEIAFFEALAELVSIQTWKKYLSNAMITLHIDNQDVVFGYVKGSTRSKGVSNVVRASTMAKVEIDAWAYYSYVISELNIADFTTRQEIFESLVKIADPIFENPVILGAHTLFSKNMLDMVQSVARVENNLAVAMRKLI